MYVKGNMALKVLRINDTGISFYLTRGNTNIMKTKLIGRKQFIDSLFCTPTHQLTVQRHGILIIPKKL